jgi:light-regulated signal transduction histidine kinase (bacteriophytochrome)
VEKLFVPFERLGASTRIEGSGIGLALCKRLIEAMGGRIGVDTVPGQGCTFWVELPLADSQMVHLHRNHAAPVLPDDVSAVAASQRYTVL